MNREWSTADVPPQFLKAAYLVGKTPRRALASDPRISYALYIPPDHYVASRPSEGDASSLPRKLPLLVYIHGTLRDTSPLDSELIPFAESVPSAIVAPLFPAGLDGPNDLDSYKRLRSPTLRSDLALLSILDEIAFRWPGIETNQVFMMGFSGGGQFAHRFLYLYPERLSAISIGAPGSHTRLDNTKQWPAGTADVQQLFGRDIDKAKIAQVSIQLIVGSDDNATHGSEEFWAWVKQVQQSGTGNNGNQVVQKEKVSGRKDSLRRLNEIWSQDGIESELKIVDGVAHVSVGMRAQVLEFLGPHMQAAMGTNLAKTTPTE